MADSSSANSRRPDEHEIVTQLKDNLAHMGINGDLALTGLIALTGFTIGRMDDSRCRLYLTYQMNEFVEFEDKDVAGHRTVKPGEFPPFGGVVMWLRRGAHVVYTRVSSRRVQADLLSGAITQAHQASTAASTATTGQQTNGSSAGAGDSIGAYVGIGPQIPTFDIC